MYSPLPFNPNANPRRQLRPVGRSVSPQNLQPNIHGQPATQPMQPASPAPVTPASAGVTPFGPGRDLRSSQIAPQASPRLAGAQGATGAAASAVGGFNRLASVGQYQNMVGGGPARSAIASQRLQGFDAEAAPQLQQQLRSVGQKAAQFGRLGSGMAAIETLQPFANLQAKRAALSHQLAADTAEGEIGDRTRAAQFGMEGADREASDLRNKFGIASDYERGVYGQEAAGRGELRGERDWQEDLARYGVDLRERQHQQEQGDTEADFRRRLARSELGMRGSEQESQQSGDMMGAFSDALGGYLARQRKPESAPAAVPDFPTAPMIRPPIERRGRRPLPRVS